MPTVTINSDPSLQDALGTIRELYQANRYLKVEIKVGKARSLDQNSISHVFYEQIARELREDNALGWKCYCKLHFGIPILRAEDSQFREFYDKTMLRTLTYEQKLNAMQYLPVTSLMSKPQLSQYLEAMQADFMQRGVKLDFPEDDK